MLLLDVNIWIYAHREDTPKHHSYRSYVEALLESEIPFGVSSLVISGFLRIVTHPKVFDPPSPLDVAIEFTTAITENPHAVFVTPGPRHWEIFIALCRQVEARGNLIPDAYFAALAIESGNTWVTADRDYSRFPGLDWRHPFAES